MVGIAQLVRAPDCGSGGRRFEPGYPPHALFRDGTVLFPPLVKTPLRQLVVRPKTRQSSHLVLQKSKEQDPREGPVPPTCPPPVSDGVRTKAKQPPCFVKGQKVGQDIGMSPSGKAPDFDSGMRRFEPFHPSHRRGAGANHGLSAPPDFFIMNPRSFLVAGMFHWIFLTVIVEASIITARFVV